MLHPPRRCQRLEYCSQSPLGVINLHSAKNETNLLAQPVAASPAERNWSVYGRIKTDVRNRMGHAVADKLVYCHEALHLKDKLQKAGFKAKVEKWDSDSDSDESDDEEDLKM